VDVASFATATPRGEVIDEGALLSHEFLEREYDFSPDDENDDRLIPMADEGVVVISRNGDALTAGPGSGCEHTGTPTRHCGR
jgi:hypothetical protein